MRWRSFVAVGDSFTEGVGDPGQDGHYRGWADRVAETLAGQRPGFRYANLAVRGRLLRQIVEEQLPVALQMRPDLVSLCGGVNDLLRPRADIAALGALLDDAVGALRSAGSDVVLFVGIDPTARSAWLGRIRPRVIALNETVRQIAEAHGCFAVDMWDAAIFQDPRLWSRDRLHLSPLGHQRTAGAVLEALKLPIDDWRAPLPAWTRPGWLATRRDDLLWAGAFAGPWVVRRIRGRSSGDGRTAKRPGLEPI